MLTIRRAQDRGHSDHGWLSSHHTFSFADYHDPLHMGFRALRVLNDDRVAPGRGFGAHPHRDMEIVSYVLEGALEHRDSMGHGSVIRPGDVQRMSAGTGVTHSECNASAREPVHFLQIWLLPSKPGLAPSYEQKTFAREGDDRAFTLVASPDGRDGSLTVHTAGSLFAGRFAPGQRARYELGYGRHAWVHVARGRVRVDGRDLEAGDAVGLSDESGVTLEGLETSEVLLFDLA